MSSDDAVVPVRLGAVRRTFGIIRGGYKIAWYAAPRHFCILLVLAFINGMVAPAVVWAGRNFVDSVFHVTRHSMSTTASIAVIASVTAVNGLLSSIYSSQLELFGMKVNNKTNYRFLNAAAQVDLGYYDEHTWQDRLQRASEAVSARPGQLMGSIIGLVGTVVSLVGLLGVISGATPAIAGLAVVAVIPTFLIQRNVEQTLYGFYFSLVRIRRRQTYLAQVMSAPRFSKEVRAFDLAPALGERLLEAQQSILERMRGLYRKANLAALGSALVSGAALAGAFAIVVHDAKRGSLTPGDLTAVIAAMASISQQASVLLSTFSVLNESGQFVSEYYAFLDTPPLIPRPADPIEIPQAGEGLVVRNLAFRYAAGRKDAIRGVSFELQPGQLMAIVGLNGSGKTTLIKCLLRLYSPSRGSVKLHGVDLAAAEPRSVRSRFGVLFQDFAQYELTLRDNVAFGRSGEAAADEEIRDALVAAQAAGLLAEFGNDLDATVGRVLDRARDLSGGQWQRLALARLIHRDAEIWVLDEPTAALDPAAEADVFRQLRTQLHGRMGIVISHRFSTVRIADVIVVMEKGRIIERGTHEELLALNGRYAELFTLQAEGYR